MHHEQITLEVDYGIRGRLQFQLPADATDDEIAYFKTLTPRVESSFSCRPSLTGESLLKTATRSAMKLRH